MTPRPGTEIKFSIEFSRKEKGGEEPNVNEGLENMKDSQAEKNKLEGGTPVVIG